MARDPGIGIARFKVGRGIAIVSPPTYVLVDPTNGAFGEKLWALLEADGGVDELLDALSAEGIRTLGDFAMAQIEDVGLRIVVRGQARARIATSSELIDLEAGTAKTWIEALYEPSVGFALGIGELSDDVLTYRFANGIVPADEIHWGELHRGAAMLEGLDHNWVDDFEPVPTGQIPHLSTATPLPAEPAEAVSRVADAQTPPSEEAIDDYDYDSLWGRTVAKSVQGAAVSSHDDDIGAPAAEPQESQPDPAVVPELASGETLAPPREDLGDSGLIDSIPIREPSSSLQKTSELDGDQSDRSFGDHDGLTVSVTRLRELREQSGEREGHGPGPSLSGAMVQAVMCAQGHASPPHAGECLYCHQPVNSVPVTVARPVLGHLMFTNGLRVDLDRPVIIGRNPKMTGSMPNEMPKLVRLDGYGYGSISRTHAMIRLESWHVLVEDLGSKFGTMVILPGQEPRRLSVGEPVLLEPGAVIDFAEEVSATYEGIG